MSSLERCLLRSFGFLFHEHMLPSCFVPGIPASSTDTLHLTSGQANGYCSYFASEETEAPFIICYLRRGREGFQDPASSQAGETCGTAARSGAGGTHCSLVQKGWSCHLLCSFLPFAALFAPFSSSPSSFPPFLSEPLNVSSLPAQIS